MDELSELTAPQPKAEHTGRKACLVSQTTNTCGQKEQYFFPCYYRVEVKTQYHWLSVICKTHYISKTTLMHLLDVRCSSILIKVSSEKQQTTELVCVRTPWQSYFEGTFSTVYWGTMHYHHIILNSMIPCCAVIKALLYWEIQNFKCGMALAFVQSYLLSWSQKNEEETGYW